MARLSIAELQAQLRSNLLTKKTAGTFIGIPSSIPYELAQLAGFDWVICDLEHGENELAQLATAVVSFQGPVIARVSSPTAENISRSLDRGASGIMIPKISSNQELADSLELLDYPPHGKRGVASYNRSGSWGHNPNALADANPVAIIQVETLYAVENIETLCLSNRIDALFIGPLDLSFALGVPRQFDSEIFKKAVADCLAEAKKQSKPIGILAHDGEKAKQYIADGFNFVAIGSDSTSLLQAFGNNLSALGK
jgi:2-dehydro-3-deoxyglucarate aldolase/4-hydroxy-2-oxoheptanedioate aldolase